MKKEVTLEEFKKDIETWPANSYMTVWTGNVQNLVDYTLSLEKKIALLLCSHEAGPDTVTISRDEFNSAWTRAYKLDPSAEGEYMRIYLEAQLFDTKD